MEETGGGGITETIYMAESGLRNERMGSERKLTQVAPGE